MDVKRLFALILNSIFCLLIIISCQKKEKVLPRVTDDENSKFSGKECYGKAKENEFIVTWSDGNHSLMYGSKEEVLKTLNNSIVSINKSVKSIEQNREFRYFLKSIEGKIENLNNLKTDKGVFWQVWGQEDVQANVLWDQKIKGEGITVAVIDGGVDVTHPSLVNRILLNEGEIPDNNIDDDNNGLIDDYKGYDFADLSSNVKASVHGTHVAGIIAAEPKNGQMLGMAPESKILPINIMSEHGGGTLNSALNAIKYAAFRNAKIINASWGGIVCAESLGLLVSDVAKQGVLFISAAGNDGVDIDLFPEFPASFDLPNQISVGASMPSGLMASFSNFGRKSVHVLAPGHLILSTVPGGWMVASGTSMAAPFVSGLAALLWGAYPLAKMSEIKEAILNSAMDPNSYNPVLSMGRINAPKALAELKIIIGN